ncbi:unannotated protein [freshwater metagenome]|uniref:Unannotated protein n=1 Tax=freshwater metagenome TaxID=449393 RepID=A0A6J7D1W7_9ZZZZ
MISVINAAINASFLSPAIVARDSPAFRRVVKVSSEIPRVEVITESKAACFSFITVFAAAAAFSAALVIASACD